MDARRSRAESGCDAGMRFGDAEAYGSTSHEEPDRRRRSAPEAAASGRGECATGSYPCDPAERPST